MPLTLPPPPEIVFGVWDRFGRLITTDNHAVAVAGYKINPSYTTYGRGVYATREEIPPTYFTHEESRYRAARRSMMIKQLDLQTLFDGRVITSVNVQSGYSSDIRIMTSGEEIVLRPTRRDWYNHNGLEMEGEFPKTVKRWLKSGKIVRCTDGTSLEFRVTGRLKIESVPDRLLNELYGVGSE